MKRKCAKCSESKDLDMFPKNALKHLGRGHTCKACSRETIDKYNKSEFGVCRALYNGQIRSSKYRKMNPPEYKFEEFSNWLFGQERFKSIFKEWVDSGYAKHLKPSVDRLNDYKTYSFDNIQLVTFSENIKKYDNDKMNGVNNKQNISVVQMDSNGFIIKEWHSAASAARELNLDSASITNCCSGKRYKTVGGYKWKYL